MSRFNSEDYDEMFPNQGQLWWANVERAIKGRHGQRDLSTLEAALLELPVKRLVHGRVAKGNEVCAVGAFAVHKRVAAGEDRAAVLAELESIGVRTYCESCYHVESFHAPEGCTVCADYIDKGMSRREEPCRVYVEAVEEDGGDWETAEVGKKAGMTFTLAWRIGQLNDEDFYSLTPEARYDAVLAWVRERIEET